jgi:hypothetical protein
MAHETSHVALRHGTNQATKAQLTSVPFAILGGIVGGDSAGGLLAQLAGSFSLNSILLKYSRSDESQADVMGTQILYDTGYDPRAMAQFFEKLNAETKGKQPAQFFSDHPNPGNRVERVDQEVDMLGGPPTNYKSDSPEFKEVRRYIRSLPQPPKSTPAGASTNSGKPEPPSTHLNGFQNDVLELRYPDNWKSNASGSTFALCRRVAWYRITRGSLPWPMASFSTNSSLAPTLPTALQSRKLPISSWRVSGNPTPICARSEIEGGCVSITQMLYRRIS